MKYFQLNHEILYVFRMCVKQNIKLVYNLRIFRSIRCQIEKALWVQSSPDISYIWNEWLFSKRTPDKTKTTTKTYQTTILLDTTTALLCSNGQLASYSNWNSFWFSFSHTLSCWVYVLDGWCFFFSIICSRQTFDWDKTIPRILFHFVY